MNSEYIKTTAKKYFLDLGMIDQNEIDTELFNTFLQNLKDAPPKPTSVGKDFASKYKPVTFDFILFSSDSCHQIDFLCENITNIIFDLGLRPENISEHTYGTENAVGAVAKVDGTFTYLGMHSYTKKFAAYSPKYPLLFVLMTQNTSKN